MLPDVATLRSLRDRVRGLKSAAGALFMRDVCRALIDHPQYPSIYELAPAALDDNWEAVGAAAALVEILLPGWCWKVGTCSISDDAWVAPDRNGPDAHLRADRLFDAGFDVDRRPPGQPSLALLEALLDALIEKGQRAQ